VGMLLTLPLESRRCWNYARYKQYVVIWNAYRTLTYTRVGKHVLFVDATI